MIMLNGMVYITVFIFLFGLIIGSFLNVCIYRLPKEESIVQPPSHCMKCGKRLTVLDLIPVLSYLLLRGKCRHCGDKISLRYPLIEVLTGLVFVILFQKYGLSIEFAATVFLMSILIAVFFIDLDHRIIPDELVLTGCIGSVLLILYHAITGVPVFGEVHWWGHLLGLLPGTGILFLVALIGLVIYKSDDAMGMGDVKLFAPIGLFLGWKLCMLVLILSVFIAGLVSLALIIIRIKKRKDTIPFGPFIVTAVMISLLWGQDIIQWYFQRLVI